MEDKIPENEPFELENQFILRLPTQPAAHLRATVASGVSLKDRLTITLDSDLRNGSLSFEHWTLHGKLYDLPTIVESWKTLDKKSFYKTADVCQMFVVKEEPDQEPIDVPLDDAKRKKEEAKRYNFAHGVTPPLKNVRKKRFRKTLKKKCIELPEIEKDVRRLFKQDLEAVSIRYELVDEDEKDKPSASASHADATNQESMSMDVNENDLFGGDISSSDEDEGDVERDNSRLLDSDSNDMSRLSDQFRSRDGTRDSSGQLITEFAKGILTQGQHQQHHHHPHQEMESSASHSMYDMGNEGADAAALAMSCMEQQDPSSSGVMSSQSEYNEVRLRMRDLELELNDLKDKKRTKEAEINLINNEALRARFLQQIELIADQIREKTQQLDDIRSRL